MLFSFQVGRKASGFDWQQSLNDFPCPGAIGALQAGNGLKRCRDRSEAGYERYVALGIVGRNLQTLGKLLLAEDRADCQAAKSKRKRVTG